jgi:phenylalanyl-tRNA synthetase beta subunit
VFTKGGEKLKLAFGVSSKAGVTAKDFKEVSDVYTKFLAHFAVSEAVHTVHEKEGVYEVDLSAFIKALPTPTAYDVHPTSPEVAYVPFSNYPHAVRDIAFWTEADMTEEKAKEVVEKNAGALLKRIDCFDRFEKEGKVSYGFRIVFQSYEKTLTAEEVDAMMQSIFSAVSACGWVVR